MRIETNIKNGLPVTAEGVIESPEPDVGLFCPYVSDLEIRWLSGHVCNLPLSEADEQRICDEILETVNDTD